MVALPGRRRPERQQRLHHLGVGVGFVTGQDQHDPGRGGTGQGEHGRVGGGTAAADQPRTAQGAHLRGQGLLHRGLVPVGQHGHRRTPLVGVGGHQLADHREDLLRPPQHHGVPLFEHGGPAPPQRGEPLRERRRDQADERRDVQQGDQREQHRHQHPQRCARRTAQPQRLPGEVPHLCQPVPQGRRRVGVGPHQHRTGRDDGAQTQQRHPAEEGGGAAGQRAVEPVTGSRAERSAPLCHLPSSPFLPPSRPALVRGRTGLVRRSRAAGPAPRTRGAARAAGEHGRGSSSAV